MNIPKIKISISVQISIFLVLVAFIPVLVMMALNTYEKQLLEMFESSNVQQGRIIAASLKAAGNTRESARLILENMNGEFISRIRILNVRGELICDSARVKFEKEKSESVLTPERKKTSAENSTAAEKSLVYRFFSMPIRIYRKLMRRPALSMYDTADFYNNKTFFDGEEIKDALSGRYGAKTRISSGDQVSVTLYSAIPVFSEDEKVDGVVLVSRSTYRILRNLYELRRDMAVVFLKSLIAVILIAVFFAFRITIPLKKLSSEATDCADKKGRIIFTNFTGSKRMDEIGELSKSFSSLIERLNKRIQFSQAFSADISHEFKNPLAAIRSAAEVLEDSNIESEDRIQLSEAIVDEVNHLQVLLSGVRNISRIDAGEDLAYEPIEVFSFLKNVVSRFEKKYEGKEFIVENKLAKNFRLKVPEDYLSRLMENLVDNAGSFGSKVVTTLSVDGNNFRLCVEDNGKGVPAGSEEKIFSRFYSERNEEERHGHSGLGLSTVKAIVDALEGTIVVEQSQSLGGAKFLVCIPVK